MMTTVRLAINKANYRNSLCLCKVFFGPSIFFNQLGKIAVNHIMLSSAIAFILISGGICTVFIANLFFD
jgi:hypothetical protein